MRDEPGALRLTGGSARGTRLFSVPGDDVRPATARLRTSIFEIMRPLIPEARVVDLFAGPGTLGLEALSRGAGWCLFIDQDARCIEAIRKNLAKTRLGDRADLHAGSALDARSRVKEDVDLVFVDPPYSLYEDRSFLGALMETLSGFPGRPLWVVEHRAVQDPGASWAGTDRTRRCHYGGTDVSFYGTLQ